MIARRAFLTGLIAAPAIVRIDALMPLRGTKLIVPDMSIPLIVGRWDGWITPVPVRVIDVDDHVGHTRFLLGRRG